jgi:hypothetical protein
MDEDIGEGSGKKKAVLWYLDPIRLSLLFLLLHGYPCGNLKVPATFFLIVRNKQNT